MTNPKHPQDPCVKQADAKQAALVDDKVFPMPRRHLLARDILDQAGVSNDRVLVRDHGGPHDPHLADDTQVDLGSGNVFRTVTRCDARDQTPCIEPAKLAFVCDDAWEITLIADQTPHSLRRLFDLADNVVLYRDLESPGDVLISPGDRIRFSDGPVFRTDRTRRSEGFTIFVNGRPQQWQGQSITFVDVVHLAEAILDERNLPTVTYTKGPPSNPEGNLVRSQQVKVTCNMEFYVEVTTQS